MRTFTLCHEVRNFARTFATLAAKLAGNTKLTVVGSFVRSGHGVRALGACKLRKYAEHKVRAKIVHIFARPVAKLSSNFRCAEPL